ncbi:unnamed protein product [Clonostachys rosea f. rosea IK726]|jgi:broad specificity phosphatase PhoE|uniref:Uncharacterized protein n=2 Tax=Bionectria ochroleuca TaxID=29856 RepID=A0A0B7KG65_BIOOC|nr:unnamed protein product [Clonostachys rosea f. rosea IK726]
MRLYLIRHGETVDNVAQLYSGSRDCTLTSHGVSQCQRLASYLAERLPASSGIHIFSSDLQRAAKTAQSICDARGKDEVVLQLPELREQHFGSGEGTKYTLGQPLVGVETQEDMRARVDRFLKDQLLPLLTPQNDFPVVIVAHGILLSVLFRRLGEHLPRGAVAVTKEAEGGHPPFAYINDVPALVVWSNTGYIEAEVTPTASADWSSVKLQVERINSVDHLSGLHKTRGGIGSAAFDEKQKTIDSFLAPKKADVSDAPQ